MTSSRRTPIDSSQASSALGLDMKPKTVSIAVGAIIGVLLAISNIPIVRMHLGETPQWGLILGAVAGMVGVSLWTTYCFDRESEIDRRRVRR